MMAKKMLTLTLIMAFSLLTQSCVVGELLPNMPNTLIPQRTLDANDDYEVIWSLPNIYMENCKQSSLITSIPGTIFVEKLSSLQAIDSLTGNTVWQIRPSSGLRGIILAQDKVLYHATTGRATVEAYNTADGMLLWETNLTGGHSAMTLYFTENKIFVSTSDDEYFVLSDQGEIVRHVSPSPMIYMEMNGILYLQNTAFRAFEIASARELWQVQADLDDPFRSPPVFDVGTIFLRTEDIDGFIYSIDQTTGKVNWKVSQKMYSNLFVAGEKIYFIGSDGSLVTIDRNSGAEISKVKFSTPFKLSDPTESYCITGDPINHVLAVAFGDNNQMLGLKIKKP
jgi:outer membrane protein assembly factor BamB